MPRLPAFHSPWLRRVAAIMLALGGIGAVLGVCSWLLAPRGEPRTVSRPPTPDEVAIISARNAIPDLTKPLVLWQDVDYAQGTAAPWFPKGEAPVLQQLVNDGVLPPVAERVGSEPLVLRGVDGIGEYGGTWRHAFWTYVIFNQIQLSYSYANLARWSPSGYPVVPHVAKGWDVNEDRTVYTIFLRRGMRWSDGHPLTADDILYWYEHEVLDVDISGDDNTLAGLLQHVDGMGRVRKVDDYTVEFIFDSPNGVFLERMAIISGSRPVGSPRHYLSRYHPKLGDLELIERTRQALRLPSARALYTRLKRPDNPEHPRLWPWLYRTPTTSPPWGFVRNPYYFAVDLAGNQLPYFDRMHWEIKSPELLAVAAANGELPLQTLFPPANQYTLLMSNREVSGYSIRHWYPTARSALLFQPNLNRKVLPDDPASRWKHQLLNDKRFRQALSVGLERRAIIDTAFLGLGEPSQLEPGLGSPFHSQKLAKAFLDYDPVLANALLDEVGLTRRDREGMRTFPDGKRMEFYVHTFNGQDIGAIQLVIDQWGDLGVRAKVLVRSNQLWLTEVYGLVHDFSAAVSLGEFIPVVNPRPFVPWGPYGSDFAPAYALWFMRGGLRGDPRALEVETGGPPRGHPLLTTMELYNQVRQARTMAEQVQHFQKILDIAAENLWTINIATAPPYLVLVKDGIKNVPELAVAGDHQYTPGNAGLETYSFNAPPEMTVGALAQLRRELTTTVTLAGTAGAGPSPRGSTVGRSVLNWTLIVAAVVCLLCLALRHPFVARRIAIMVPTLAVISVLTFIIIQLPPGDYLTTLMLRYEQEGGETSEKMRAEFRELFHLDKSPVGQYLQWAGVTWFFSFKPEDRGLLQGYLGRSMEPPQRPVNHIVGDRILLTVLISAGTILFTWILAIPIGIYSAVRQYSPGDYIATLVGLVGMSVPSFLLAILAMYFASKFGGLEVTGLFSAEYAVQPNWTWGKFVDLLKHIWVPVLILGIGGTASMVRVMRGNLLDELNKPYVRTAQAKGMRPWRLIIKYPVRLAINPFVSGVGTLFPQLISGGAITAVILSLPTVGPLMLEAFRSEDMYLAGSMLMVLSFLGIFGTLVSDLLLLALDPRIRMERSGGR